jgi:hypothetical protein
MSPNTPALALGVALAHHDKQTRTYTLRFKRDDPDGTEQTSTLLMKGSTYLQIASIRDPADRLARVRQALAEYTATGIPA